MAISAVAALTAWGVWDTWMSVWGDVSGCMEELSKRDWGADLEMCRLARQCCRNQRHCDRYILLIGGVWIRAPGRKGPLTRTCQCFLLT